VLRKISRLNSVASSIVEYVNNSDNYNQRYRVCCNKLF
jgi:hypothetical protein